ncbi:hypothetical protein [Kineosporia sp. NBRC 101677]|uniref:hypothetical protein n=1 Tax=Kineosporia sp. NBRC 101677 TaxID=3032197 RepID=UPI002556DA4D|nr:hypothetical protein [Kineosporia sp. NBRC 101677]
MPGLGVPGYEPCEYGQTTPYGGLRIQLPRKNTRHEQENENKATDPKQGLPDALKLVQSNQRKNCSCNHEHKPKDAQLPNPAHPFILNPLLIATKLNSRLTVHARAANGQVLAEIAVDVAKALKNNPVVSDSDWLAFLERSMNALVTDGKNELTILMEKATRTIRSASRRMTPLM